MGWMASVDFGGELEHGDSTSLLDHPFVGCTVVAAVLHTFAH